MQEPSFPKPAIFTTEGSNEGASLAQRVAEQLRDMIMDGRLTPESQLPNEPDLSLQLNVSRTTVRSALTILEQGGFIQRRWGVGTFVAKNPPTYKNLNINSGVTQLIQSSGAKPGSAEILITSRPASEYVANRLSLDPGTPVIVVERVRLANDQRVVFTQDYLPESTFKTEAIQFSLEEIRDYLSNHQSMYALLHEHISLDIHHGIAWIRPAIAEGYIAEKLQVSRGSSLLHIEQVDYASNGDPVALSDEYYIPESFVFYVYRAG